jgi:hypothetical protein
MELPPATSTPQGLIRHQPSGQRHGFDEADGLQPRRDSAKPQLVLLADVWRPVLGGGERRAEPYGYHTFRFMWETASPQQRDWVKVQCDAIGYRYSYLDQPPSPPAREEARRSSSAKEITTATLASLDTSGAALGNPARRSRRDARPHATRTQRTPLPASRARHLRVQLPAPHAGRRNHSRAPSLSRRRVRRTPGPLANTPVDQAGPRRLPVAASPCRGRLPHLHNAESASGTT